MKNIIKFLSLKLGMILTLLLGILSLVIGVINLGILSNIVVFGFFFWGIIFILASFTLALELEGKYEETKYNF